MRILRLEVAGYRSLKEQTWTPGPLNVVIGPNGSGKSNLLSVLEMLSHAAEGRLGEFVRREGGMGPVLWDGRAERVRIRAKMSPIPPYRDEVKDALTYGLVLERLGASSTYRIANEALGNFCKVEDGSMGQPFLLLERDTRHRVIFSMEQQEFGPPADSVPEDEALLSVARGPFAPNPFAAKFCEEILSWSIYQGFHTGREAGVRQATVSRTETRVQPDGQNLVSFLHTLYDRDREFEQELNTAMRSAFSEDFDKLQFPPAADQRVQLHVRWKSLRRAHSAADLSDGILRFLYLLAILANPAPPPLIAIDEPEVGLHPSMLPIVAEYARDAASRTQVILTTHSPEFLDAFGDEPPTTTVVEWRDGETHLRVLSGERLDYWLKKYTLGELYRSNELEAMA